YKVQDDNDIVMTDTQNESETQSTVDDYYNQYPELHEYNNNVIITQAAQYKIYDFIKKYNNSKAAGPEKIPVIVFNTLKESKIFLSHISDLFTYCLRLELNPTQWNESLISIIPKNNKNDFTINNSRGIALTAFLRRIYEKIILKTTELKQFSTGFELHPNQQGFIKKTGTIPNLLIIHDSFKLGRKIKTFIDLKAAYDRTDINIILKNMEHRLIPTKLINIIKNLFSGCSSRVIFNNETSDTFKRETGIFQGSILAPLLFNIFIDTLAHELQKEVDIINTEYNNLQPNEKSYESIMPHFLFFADDIVINGRDKHEIQRLLNIIGDWCQTNGMLPGFNKCNYISDKDHDLLLLHEKLARTDSYKYLGLPITHEGIDFKSYIKAQGIRTRLEFEKIKISGNYFRSHSHKVNVIKSHVSSHLEYAISIIGLLPKSTLKDLEKEIKDIEIIINQSRQWASNVSHIYQTLASWMTNLWSYTTLLKYRKAALQEQILKLEMSNPIRQLILANNQIPKNIANELLSLKTTNSTIYADFIKEQITKNPRLTLVSYINQMKKQTASESHTACYTLPSRKNNKSNTDLAFSIKNQSTQRNAICWRQRIVYTEAKAVYRQDFKDYKCSHCDKEFSIAHVMQCKLITEYAKANPKLWVAFDRELSEFRKNYPQAKNYTYLDFLLNNRHFKLFQELYLKINKNLVQKEKIKNILKLSACGSEEMDLE
ncbi:MAG: hypothetical protein RLZZ86_3916, partial [Cyanobacteriota bacterium]